MDVSEKKRSDIKFTYCANGTKLFIANDGIYYQFMNAKTAQSIDLHRIDMKLVGASIPSEVVKGQKSEYFENYYLAGNAALNVHGYAKLTFKNIYPKIDWVIYTKEGVLEYDFIVHPGGNPNVIKINYSYADKIELTANGELAITSRLGKLIEGKPHSFSASSNDAVRSNFVLQHNTLSFELGDYDKTQSLVIDPTLVWSRYAGGNLAESVNKVTDNMAFGSTLSTFGIATNGGFQTIFGGVMDAFYSYFDNSGTITYSTYFGGSGSDEALSGLFVSDGATSKALMVGQTTSFSGIAQAGLVSYANLNGTSDGFVAVFLENGTLQFSSYFGGNSDDYISDVKQIGAPNDYTKLIISGASSSSIGFNATNLYQGGMDAFIAKLDITGGNITNTGFTYLGGTANENSNTLSLGKNNTYFLSGNTESSSGIATAGAFDVTLGGTDDDFIARFDANLALDWATYYGGNASEKTGSGTNGSYCAVDTSGFVYLLGNSTSGGLNTPGAYDNSINGLEDFFLVKFDSLGNRIWATYYGGFLSDIATSIAINNNNLILLGGYSNSPFMDIDGIKFVAANHNNNDIDALIVEFNTSGQFFWSSPLGTSQGNEVFNSLAFSSNNIIAGGSTNSAFGIAYNSSSSYSGGGDGLIARINDRAIITNAISNSSLCPGDSVMVSFSTIGNFPANTIFRAELYTNFSTTNPVILGTKSNGSGTIHGYIPIATGAAFSGNTIKVVTNLPVNPPIASTSQTVGAIGSLPNAHIYPLTSTTICDGNSVVLKSPSNTNIVFRQWQQFKNSAWVNIAGANSISFAADSAGAYRVITTSVTGCDSTSNSINVIVQGIPSATISSPGQLFCLGNKLVLSANTGAGLTYLWYKNNLLLNGRTSDTLEAVESGTYSVKVTNGAGCSTTSAGFIVTGLIKPPAHIAAIGNTAICIGQNVVLSANNSPGVSYQWFRNDTLISGATLRTFAVVTTGNYFVKELNTNNCDSTSNTLHVDVYPYPNAQISYNGIPYTCLGNQIELSTISNLNYTYQWLFNGLAISGANDTNYSASNGGDYAIIITNHGVCSDTSAITTINPTPMATDLCYASIDTAYGGKTVAKVFWQKPAQPYVKGYVIYREKSGQGFVPIDTISNTLYSSYIDSSARPESTVERYKIATLDSCGNQSDIGNSTIHQTMLLQGALDPTNTYIGWDWEQYLGISDPTRYYRIMRDKFGTGVWDSIKSTPWSVTSWNDTAINYPTAKYAVDLVWQGNCEASQRIMAGFNTSRSNIKNRAAITVGIAKNNLFNVPIIYPNPVQNLVNIQFESFSKNAVIYLIDVLGNNILEKNLDHLNGETRVQLSLDKIAPGVYFIILKTESGNRSVKLMKE